MVGSSPGVGVGYAVAVGLGDTVGVAVGVGVGSALAAEFPLMAAPINPEIASTQAVNKSALRRFIVCLRGTSVLYDGPGSRQ